MTETNQLPDQAARVPTRSLPVGVLFVADDGTIYQIVLAGSAGFRKAKRWGGSDREAVLKKVQQGDFPRPREVNRDVPAPLEAICLKAMALDPANRYQTAVDLAADVECWLADEPVSAHQDSLPEKASRWTRRHRSWVQVGQ